MIQYVVGVGTIKEFKVYRIDNDYFEKESIYKRKSVQATFSCAIKLIL